jgi:hypothetical protein
MKHMHDHHLAESVLEMGFWELLIAHIKFYPTRDAIFHGKIWTDDSRAPEKNTQITIDIHLEGGEPPRRIPSTHVWVYIEDRQPFTLGLLRGQEWRQFKTCMDGLFREIGWSATFEGDPWFDQSRVPVDNQKIRIQFHLDGGREVETIQVFTVVPNQPTHVIDLQVG